MGLLKGKDSDLAAQHINETRNGRRDGDRAAAILAEINRRIQDRQNEADRKRR